MLHIYNHKHGAERSCVVCDRSLQQVTSYTNNFPDAGFDGEIWVKVRSIRHC
jgi:hypothetical protein